jgi:carboxyl-terminal processing protease
MAPAGRFILALSCALLFLAVGLWLGGHPERLPGPLRDAFVDDDRALRAEVVDEIKDNFYRPVNDDAIDESSLKGIVEGLDDQFSQYLTPTEAKQFRESTQGQFEGVGMVVEKDRRGLRVLELFDGPAKRAGIRKGEYITAVNGRSIARVSSEVATARIKGPVGTRVRLEVLSRSRPRPRTLSLRRARIKVEVAKGRIVERDGRRLAVVELTTFSSGAHGALRQQIERQLRRGAQAILLDLRGNPGGLLREAVLVSSIFVEDGLITYTKGRTKPRRDFDAQGDAIDTNIPVVVLVDGGSASASEIVTGALRDRKRATVVGTKTFGKGVFQEVKDLSDGSLLELTVGSYFLPKGDNLADNGIPPQVKARDLPRTRRDEALPVALRALADRLR